MGGLDQEADLETHEVQFVVLEVKEVEVLWWTAAFVLS